MAEVRVEFDMATELLSTAPADTDMVSRCSSLLAHLAHQQKQEDTGHLRRVLLLTSQLFQEKPLAR